jgi:hypothetical protein
VGRVASNVRVDTRVSAFLCSVDDERLREGSAVRHAARAEGAERLAGYAAWRRDRETRNGGRIVAGRPVPPEHADLDSPDGYLLGGLGIAPSHERVYRVLLRHGSADVSELAQLTTLSPGALRRVVAVLEVEGALSHDSPGGGCGSWRRHRMSRSAPSPPAGRRSSPVPGERGDPRRRDAAPFRVAT